MNYISHLSAFYAKMNADKRFTPHHISLYSGIFQLWNAARFKNPVHVNRTELMNLSKIGSVNTYIRCLKELVAWEYIEYLPSRNISIGSQIRVIIFDNSTGNSAETRLRHSNKPIKTILNLPSQKEVDEFFKKEGYPEQEAERYFSHYTANGWMMGTSPVQNWQQAAKNWMTKARNFAAKKIAGSSATNAITLNKTSNHYEPL